MWGHLGDRGEGGTRIGVGGYNPRGLHLRQSLRHWDLRVSGREWGLLHKLAHPGKEIPLLYLFLDGAAATDFLLTFRISCNMEQYGRKM